MDEDDLTGIPLTEEMAHEMLTKKLVAGGVSRMGEVRNRYRRAVTGQITVRRLSDSVKDIPDLLGRITDLKADLAEESKKLEDYWHRNVNLKTQVKALVEALELLIIRIEAHLNPGGLLEDIDPDMMKLWCKQAREALDKTGGK